MMDSSVSSDGFAGSVPVVTNPPPPLATETVPRPSPRQRLLAALTGLLPRNLPASNPLSGGATPPSSLYKRASRALGVTAFLAALAVGLLFLLPGGLVRAQQTIEYPENGTGPVATFTAVDPELAGAITWSLADMGDADDFEISNRGVLTFVKSPDYEAPASGDENNEYEVTVVATDADRMTTDEAVTVEVTNVDEPGTVTLSAVAPYPGVELTATHSDLDDGINGAEWQWSRSGSKSGSYTAIEDAEEATYTPDLRRRGLLPARHGDVHRRA